MLAKSFCGHIQYNVYYTRARSIVLWEVDIVVKQLICSNWTSIQPPEQYGGASYQLPSAPSWALP